MIDVIEGDRAYIPGMYFDFCYSIKRSLYLCSLFLRLSFTPVLYVFNKIDSLWIEELDILDRLDNVVPSTLYPFFALYQRISAQTNAVDFLDKTQLVRNTCGIWKS